MESKIDYEGIWRNLIQFRTAGESYGMHLSRYDASIEYAMKAAVREAVPIILEYAAEKAKLKYVNSGLTIKVVNKESIIGLEQEIIKQLEL